MMELPEAFKEKMKLYLGAEYEPFLKSYDRERALGLRRNSLKLCEEDFLEMMPWRLSAVPWASEGFYYGAEDRPGKHPYHEAGLYYIQEPSAMAVAGLLDPVPGDRVLDLCAAPGGKTTHIAGKLMGQGILVSNEIHPSRAKILSQNVERMGIVNCVVTNESPEKLAGRFEAFFDKIVVDAPCSGEGMFRKDEAARLEWSEGHVKLCAGRQAEILDCGARMLKPGGRMVYSTCTFSPEENEQTIEAFLTRHDDFTVEDRGSIPGLSRGRGWWIRNASQESMSAGIECTYRIWPHESEGEGHYLAVLRRKGEKQKGLRLSSPAVLRDKKLLKDMEVFLKELVREPERFRAGREYLMFGGQIYLVPEDMPDDRGLKVLRPGLHLAALKKDRFEPSHALALSLSKEQAVKWHELTGIEEAVCFLKGWTLNVDYEAAKAAGEKGWIILGIHGYPLGFAKLSGGILKNHYPKGLRWM